eukprot:COSAG02_NODE_18648_length_927_cov_0.993961_1_plen_24_part_10
MLLLFKAVYYMNSMPLLLPAALDS